MRAISTGSGRYPTRTTSRATISVVVAASLAAAAATWRGCPVAVIATLLGGALGVSVFFLVRTELCRASVLIDTILRDELDTEPSASPVDELSHRDPADRYGG